MSFGGSSADHRFIDETIDKLQKHSARISAVVAREQRHSVRRSTAFSIACCRSLPPTIPPNQNLPISASSSTQSCTVSKSSGLNTDLENSAFRVATQRDPSDVLRLLGEHEVPCFLKEGNKKVERMANIKVYSKDTSAWLWLHYILKDSNGKEVLVINTEVKGAETRNLVVNERKLE